ncbi:hypothetical protein [Aquincola tertiaricarbonis]|uniref:hypothetical protein n=1 Tax=Aquincola tertiaricarbonis TaxID=391953 RepID=UPI000614A125|nr:hypothetical protein [Aquincola tertiaricarbonis]
MTVRRWLLVVLLANAGSAWAQATTVYRCPGPPVLYTDQLSPREAQDRGCRTIESAPVTVMQNSKPRPVASPNPPGGSPAAPAARGSEGRIDPGEQRARDADARRILEAELRKEQDRLATMKQEFNNGQPERQGNERNYQRYLDRVEEMRSAIQRKEGDVEAIRRELSRLPS